MISTSLAPQAIGPYSQAVRVGNTIYLSGQVGFNPATMSLVSEDFAAQAEQTFKNINAVVTACGATLAEIAKLTIYVTDLSEFSKLNEVMANYFKQPYPARTTIQVSALPRGAKVEIEGIVIIA